MDAEEPLGIDRSDDPLLSLAESAQPFREAIVATAHYYCRLTGLLSSPIGKKYAARQMAPKCGDLVYIPDAMRKHPEDRVKGFGYLIEARDEPIYDQDLWDKVRAKRDSVKPPRETVYYVQFGPAPADVCGWTNATCMTVPTEKLAAELWRNGRWS